MIVEEITDEKLAEIRAASCSTLIQSLVMRLDRVEGEKTKLHDLIYGEHGLDERLTAADTAWTAIQNENIALRERVKELTQCDPSWYDASPADAFMLLKKAQERVKRMESALQRIAKWHGEFPDTGRTWDDGEPMSYAACWGSNGERDYMRKIAQAALKEGE